MLKNRLQRYFLTGLLSWLPLVITVWVLLWLMRLIDSVFAHIVKQLARVVPPIETFSNWVQGIPGIGVLTLGTIILLTGLLVTHIVGQWWVRQLDRVFDRIPVFRSIYSSVRQVSDTLFADNGKAFSKALLVEYPRRGCWSIGLLTGSATGEFTEHLQGEHISVFIPTTPNPISGFILILPRAEVIELRMTVDEALKYIISMGVVVPGEAAEQAREQGTLPLPPVA